MTREDTKALIRVLAIAAAFAIGVVLIGYGIAWLPSLDASQCVTMVALESL